MGAGPYGLACAAYLRSRQVETRIWGEPMAFWERHMPAGMLLRSAWEASHIADPRRALTLDRYQTERGEKLSTPVPVDDFIAYGRWFQQQVAPDVDRRCVEQVESRSNGFRLTLNDGETVEASRVVIATGLQSFAYHPPIFRDLPAALASHSSEQRDLAAFRGRRVLVIGGGQSALEAAALLHEGGAGVEVLVRAAVVHWLRGAQLRKYLGPLRPLVYPSTDVGPPGLNWIVAAPGVFAHFPRRLFVPLARRAIRPAGAGWLPERLADVTLTLGREVVNAVPSGRQLRLSLDDGSERLVDHVLLATGYRVDVARYRLLSPDLLQALHRVDGYPGLGAGFESSVPNLHFVGAAAAGSFGPLMRFVSGTGYTARTLTRHVVQRGATGSP